MIRLFTNHQRRGEREQRDHRSCVLRQSLSRSTNFFRSHVSSIMHQFSVFLFLFVFWGLFTFFIFSFFFCFRKFQVFFFTNVSIFFIIDGGAAARLHPEVDHEWKINYRGLNGVWWWCRWMRILNLFSWVLWTGILGGG